MKTATGLLPASIACAAWIGGMSLPPRSHAHLDPPTNPPVQTQVDVVKLIIHDASYRPWGMSKRKAVSVLNDGFAPAGYKKAELLVVAEIDWGGDHGSSFWKWTGEAYFHHLVDMYYKPALKAIGYTTPANTNIGSHQECSPILAPKYNVEAYEVDKGSGWEEELAEAIASDVGASTIAYVLKKGLSGFKGNDPIPVNVGVPDGQDNPSQPEVEIQFRSSTVKFPPQEGCKLAGEVAHAIPPNYKAPPPPNGVPKPPSVGKVTLSDDYLEAERSVANASRKFILSDYLRQRLNFRLESGIDDYHPFGRTVTYARSRFDDLLARLKRIAQTPYLGSELSLSEFNHNREHAQKILVGLAYMAAARTVTEAAERLIAGASIPQSALQSAELRMTKAGLAADTGNYEAAIQDYKAATLSLFPSLFKQFVERRLEPKLPEPIDIGLRPINPPFSISPAPVAPNDLLGDSEASTME